MQTDLYPFDLEDFDPDQDTITSVIVEPAQSPADRSIARRASLQILYELDSTRHPVASVIDAHIQERPEAYAVRQIIRRLVEGVIARQEEIDLLIQCYAPEWPVHQVATVDRNILRIGVYEHLLQGRVTPVPVIINEAVHLAQLFGAENSHSFVHGVLGAITSNEALRNICLEELTRMLRSSGKCSITTTDGKTAKWDNVAFRYRNIQTGKFEKVENIDPSLHQFIMDLSGNREQSRPAALPLADQELDAP